MRRFRKRQHPTLSADWFARACGGHVAEARCCSVLRQDALRPGRAHLMGLNSGHGLDPRGMIQDARSSREVISARLCPSAGTGDADVLLNALYNSLNASPSATTAASAANVGQSDHVEAGCTPLSRGSRSAARSRSSSSHRARSSKRRPRSW